MFTLPVFRKPSLYEALPIAILLIGGMGYLIIVQEWIPHMTILTAIVALVIYGLVVRIPYSKLQTGMIESVFTSFAAIYLFFAIGLLVSALMMVGTIPTLIYYGLALIAPQVFYVSVFVICAVVGITIGSSLTTCATIGVAFMAMGMAFDASAAVTAGAIVSGAFFGDKMSPISDTTIIAAATVGVDVFEHIKNMTFTTFPAFILTLLALWLLTPGSNGFGDFEQIARFRTALAQTNLIHWYAFIPFIWLITLAMLRINAVVVMLTTVMISLVLTYLHLGLSVTDIGNYFYHGFSLAGVVDQQINSLVARGGISSMFFTMTLVILGLSLGGLLFALGIIPRLLESMQHFLTTAARSTFSVAATAVGVNFLVGEQYLSILLTGETFKNIYDKLNLHRKNLARTLEDAGTVINPLVPWSVSGVFISQTLGVAVWEYFPYAFFCYLCLVLTLLFGFTGVTLTKLDSQAKD